MISFWNPQSGYFLSIDFKIENALVPLKFDVGRIDLAPI